MAGSVRVARTSSDPLLTGRGHGDLFIFTNFAIRSQSSEGLGVLSNLLVLLFLRNSHEFQSSNFDYEILPEATDLQNLFMKHAAIFPTKGIAR